MILKHAAALLALTLLASVAGAQAVYPTGFEAPVFTLGDVNGQDGWGHLSNSPTGGTIVPVPAGSPAMFGAQSLALVTRQTASFPVANHLFSPLIDPPAGENGSTAGAVIPDPRSHFAATLWVRTPTMPVISTRTDGRFAELNPSSKIPGAANPANRYAQVRLVNTTNTPQGVVRVEMGYYHPSGPFGFIVAPVANLGWGQWYRFEYLLELVDGLNGAEPNDRFTLTIFDVAGTQLGTVCGSTWELGWKSGTFGGGATARAVNGFDFWSSTGPDGTLVAHLDQLTMTAFDAEPLAAMVTGNASVCFGGTTTLSAMATGGAGPATSYVWRNAAMQIVGTNPTLVAGAGTYTVSITDPLCVTATSAPFVVSENAQLAVSISGPSTVAVGDVATLTANPTGGSGTIASYEWRNAQDNVVGNGPTFDAQVGTYTVTVTDQTCGTATSAPFTVSAAVVPVVPTTGELGLLVMLAALTLLAVARLR